MAKNETLLTGDNHFKKIVNLDVVIKTLKWLLGL